MKQVKFSDVLTYLKCRSMAPSKATFYIMTTSINEISLLSIIAPFPKLDISYDKKLTGASINLTDIPSVLQDSFKRPALAQPRLTVRQDIVSNKVTKPVQPNATNIIDEENLSPINKYNNSKSVSTIPLKSSIPTNNTITTTSHSVEAGTMAVVVDSFTVLYYLVTGNTVDEMEYYNIPKKDLFNTLIRLGQLQDVDNHEFEPVINGYPISQIMKNGLSLFIRNVFGNEIDTSLVWPIGMNEEGLIIYGCDEFRGMCNGEYGIGVIPSYIEDSPRCAWYKNDELYCNRITRL